MVDLLTTADVADRLGVTTGRVRQIVRAGILAPVFAGGRGVGYLYRPEDVERLRAEREAATA